MIKNKPVSADQNLEKVEEVLSKTEQFIENNQKTLLIVISIIVIIVGGYFGYKKFYLAPLEKEAQSSMFMAEIYFEKDSFNLALNGDGQNPGFLSIIDDYGSTKSGNLANYYAGISFLKTGKYQEAINYLEDFSSEDQMVGPIAIGSIGDANMELGKKEEAYEYYIKAAESGGNTFVAPIYLMKAAFASEIIGNYQQALEIYERLQKEYPNTYQGSRVDKYIARVKVKLGVQ